MPYPDSFVLLVMGGAFIGAGFGVIFGSKRAEKRYHNTLSTRTDVREFLETTPERSGYGALRLGGLISIIVGTVLLGIGGGIRLWA